MRLFSWIVIVCAALAISPRFSAAQSIYGISIDTSRIRGSQGRLVFDITSNTPLTNRFDVINFSTDGTTGVPETQGDLVAGDLIQNSRPAKFTRIKANTFFTELAVPFIAFGYQITFTINVSETGPVGGRPPDEFALYMLDEDGKLLGNSSIDGRPNVSVTITGARGGELQISRQTREFSETDDPSYQSGPEKALRQFMPVGPTVTLKITPAWTRDDPALLKNARTIEGTLTEFCNRRCAGETICTGGAFAVVTTDNTFYKFDDVSNLKAQVAIVESGKNPLAEGQFGPAQVVANVNGSFLTVHKITLF